MKHICNLCGLPCDPNNGCGEMGLLDASVCGGYHSTAGNGFGALDDLTEYRFSLCEFCLDWLFGKFQIPVEVRNYMCEDVKEQPEPWRPAIQRVEEDEWRRAKDDFMTRYLRCKNARRG